MTTQPAQRLLRTPDAAILLGLSARTLEKHRCYGTGPAYRKLGGRVVYSVDDLLSWADQGVRRSTSDTTASVVHPAKRIDTSVLERKGAVRR
ncbi:helix-turn-helix domain-containing protein [Sphingomonas sp.]|jgi:predicted DNA-binding transcriptional regulator AlpA|uniref:helix-turn-helix transcriptional regulator n=1 Tax=Sphingomonas sp. TaxID=28214 RepID=UPI002ED9B82E